MNRFPELTRKEVIKMLEGKGLEWKVDKYGDLLYLDVFKTLTHSFSKDNIYMWVQAPVTNKQAGEFLDSIEEV